MAEQTFIQLQEEDLVGGQIWKTGVLTIYTEKPESPGGKLNGSHHSVRNFPGKVSLQCRRIWGA